MIDNHNNSCILRRYNTLYILLQLVLLFLSPSKFVDVVESFSITITGIQNKRIFRYRPTSFIPIGVYSHFPYTTTNRKMSTSEQQQQQQQQQQKKQQPMTATTDVNTDNKLVLSLRHYLSKNDDNNADNNDNKISLILASQSPRRKEILDMMGLSNYYKVIVSPLNESSLAETLLLKNKDDDTTSAITNNDWKTISPIDYTRILAEEKAMSLANHIAATNTSTTSNTTTTYLVLGSDTIVVLDDITILEKPKNTSDAITMLQTLSNRCHTVITGVALVQVTIQNNNNNNNDATTTTTASIGNANNNVVTLVSSFTDTAIVQFASLSYNDIVSYVNTGEPMDKSGSYGIQGIGGQLVQSINGDFFTVMGLPMHRTSTMLASAITSIIQDSTNRI